VTTVYGQNILVPRASLPPVFDHLQYANMEGEGLGDMIMVAHQVDTRGCL